MLQIPRSAIIEEAGTSSVYVISDDVVEKRIIHTGYTEGGMIEVLDGIEDNDQIVFVGHTNLKDGSKVSVIKTIDAADLIVNNGPSSDGIEN